MSKWMVAAKKADFESIAEKLDSHPMSDVTFVLREAGRMAVKSRIEYINQICFDKALDMLPKKEEKRKIGFNQ
jgi:ATP-dependent 26S proteasome regulatory subunit